jgi:Tol biopolymer transport system component
MATRWRLGHPHSLCGALVVVATLACSSSDVTNPSAGMARGESLANDVSATALTGKIAFVSNRVGNAEIYRMNLSNKSVTRLTHNSVIDADPAWSPTGSKIAFARFSSNESNEEIFVMNADGSGVIRLTNNLATNRSPAWSPDGSKIAFVTNRVDHDEIFVMKANGAGVTQLTHNLPVEGCSSCLKREESPSWSPDGTKIAFLHPYSLNGGLVIYVMNANGTGVTRLFTRFDFIRPIFLARVSWEPITGKIIAFDAQQAPISLGPRTYDIWVVNSTGGTASKRTNNPANDRYPAWSPDGTKIAFESDRDGNFEIYAISSSGAVTRLTNNAAFDGEPAWGP